MKLKKGDKIQVITGAYRGKDGAVERVYAKQNKVLVQGVNLYKRHIKKSQETPEGGIIDIPRAIDVSKIMLVCPKCKKTTRIGYKEEKGKKVRVCRKCKNVIK